MSAPREYLLLASYCGNDTKRCTEGRPCPACLDMCNVFTITDNGTTVYEREFRQGDAQRAKRRTPLQSGV